MKSPEELALISQGIVPEEGGKRKRNVKDAPKKKVDLDLEKEFKETVSAKERYLDLDFTSEYTTEQYLKKMKKPTNDISAYTDIQEPILLKMLREVKNKTQRIDVLYFLIIGSFSIIKGHVDYYMERNKWNLIINCINELIDLIEEGVVVNDKRKGKIHLCRFFENSHRELHTAFQRLQPQNIEYVKRLNDEHRLLNLGERILKFYKAKNDDSNVAKTSLIMLNHLYAKHNSIYRKMQELVESKSAEEKKNFYILKPEQTEAKINELVENVFEEGYTKSYRIQAMLYQIYHHAIHNRFYIARNKMSTSQISEKINKQDEQNQILYNRTIVQIGLSAFRIGLFEECFDITKEIANYGRLKELLAQTVKNASTATEKQIRKEKERYIPYHLHIDTELVDFIHMTCAMLLEIPNISKSFIDRNIISRPFRKLVDSADNALFNGPPEQSREYVIYAARSLYHGEWRKALEFLFGAAKVWKLIPEHEDVKEVLTRKVKEVAFKVLMFRNSRFYDSYSISDLGDLFELTSADVHKLASKLIIRERFNIKIKEDQNVIQINESPLNETQSLANVLAEKVKVVIDHNQQIAYHIKKTKASNAARDAANLANAQTDQLTSNDDPRDVPKEEMKEITTNA